MITSLKIGNFKAFGEGQNIPLKPITLIFGANSSGKSSIIHSLALVHEAIRTGELDVVHTEIGGNSIDLGGFRQYIHRGEIDRCMELSFKLSNAPFEMDYKEILEIENSIAVTIAIGISLDKNKRIVADATPEVVSYTVHSNGNILYSICKKPDGSMGFEFSPNKSKLFQKLSENFLKDEIQDQRQVKKSLADDSNLLEKAVAEIHESITVLFSSIFSHQFHNNKGPFRSTLSNMAALYFGGALGLTLKKALSIKEIAIDTDEKLVSAFQLYFFDKLYQLSEKISEHIQFEIRRLKYLGPLRSYPARHFSFLKQEDKNWMAGGGYAWDKVLSNKEIRDKVNAWLSDEKRLNTPYQLSIKEFVPIEEFEKDYQALISMVEKAFVDDDWSVFEKRFGEKSSGDLFGELGQLISRIKEKGTRYPRKKELIIVDRINGTQLSPRDVGIGISQVLPVLVSSYASSDQIIAIEQPELHLHPALQAELGDVFIESALGDNGNTIIVETHSEHLILRILRRIRETSRGNNKNAFPVRPEDIALLFVSGTKKGAIVKELRIDKRGRLIDQCPGGFFEEDFEELF